jgi:hypothetical protein
MRSAIRQRGSEKYPARRFRSLQGATNRAPARLAQLTQLCREDRWKSSAVGYWQDANFSFQSVGDRRRPPRIPRPTASNATSVCFRCSVFAHPVTWMGRYPAAASAPPPWRPATRCSHPSQDDTGASQGSDRQPPCQPSGPECRPSTHRDRRPPVPVRLGGTDAHGTQRTRHQVVPDPTGGPWFRPPIARPQFDAARCARPRPGQGCGRSAAGMQAAPLTAPP